MGIGSYRCTVIDVADLAIGERFWSEVTGLAVIGSNWMGRFSYLGRAQSRKHEIILQLVAAVKKPEANRAHIDITPDHSVDDAIRRIVALAGKVKKPPSLYPRPGSSDEPPVIDWAVMQDPFGNEFCLVSELTPEQIETTLAAAASGVTGDQEWRIAAGVSAR